MTRSLQVVTIDGLRGAGKSWLASSLRDRFGCNVLDIGPIFRLIAWLVEQNLAADPINACQVLELALKAEWIRIRLEVGGRKTASRIEVRGCELEDELWDIKLDSLIREAADSPKVICRVSELAHQLVGYNPATVVGREVGATIFPDARLKIILQAGEEKRLERKISQLSAGSASLPSDYSLDRSEPMKRWNHTSLGSIIIDTTSLSQSDVLERASAYIMCRLGWLQLKDEAEAYAT